VNNNLIIILSIELFILNKSQSLKMKKVIKNKYIKCDNNNKNDLDEKCLNIIEIMCRILYIESDKDEWNNPLLQPYICSGYMKYIQYSYLK